MEFSNPGSLVVHRNKLCNVFGKCSNLEDFTLPEILGNQGSNGCYWQLPNILTTFLISLLDIRMHLITSPPPPPLWIDSWHSIFGYIYSFISTQYKQMTGRSSKTPVLLSPSSSRFLSLSLSLIGFGYVVCDRQLTKFHKGVVSLFNFVICLNSFGGGLIMT